MAIRKISKSTLSMLTCAEMLLDRYAVYGRERYQDSFDEEEWLTNVSGLCQWLAVEVMPTVSDKTFRRYRQSLTQYSGLIGKPELSCDLSQVGSKKRGPKVNVTPLKRSAIESERGIMASHIRKDDVVNLMDRLIGTRKNGKPTYATGGLALSWLRMIMLTGIRPSEFRGAHIHAELTSKWGTRLENIIEVVGARKGALDRTQESERIRYLSLSAFGERDLDELRMLIDALPSDKEQFDSILKNVQRTIMQANMHCFKQPNGVTLYTGRHIYAAEFRRGRFGSNYSLAAALGHADIINQKYYGDYKDLDERQFAFPLALPVTEAIEIVFHAAKRRQSRTLDRLQKLTARQRAQEQTHSDQSDTPDQTM